MQENGSASYQTDASYVPCDWKTMTGWMVKLNEGRGHTCVFAATRNMAMAWVQAVGSDGTKTDGGSRGRDRAGQRLSGNSLS